MNLQHLESLNDQVLQISGILFANVPDWVIKRPQSGHGGCHTDALINRLKRGRCTSREGRTGAGKFFQRADLVALRELALRQAAHEVEARHGESVPSRRDPRIAF
jgi:two-component system sensor histidine kinase KdpD